LAHVDGAGARLARPDAIGDHAGEIAPATIEDVGLEVRLAAVVGHLVAVVEAGSAAVDGAAADPAHRRAVGDLAGGAAGAAVAGVIAGVDLAAVGGHGVAVGEVGAAGGRAGAAGAGRGLVGPGGADVAAGAAIASVAAAIDLAAVVGAVV